MFLTWITSYSGSSLIIGLASSGEDRELPLTSDALRGFTSCDRLITGSFETSWAIVYGLLSSLTLLALWFISLFYETFSLLSRTLCSSDSYYFFTDPAAASSLTPALLSFSSSLGSSFYEKFKLLLALTAVSYNGLLYSLCILLLSVMFPFWLRFYRTFSF